MNAADIAKALGGHPAGQGRYLCPCPVPNHGKGKGDRNPSLSIYDGDKTLLVTCFAGCDRHDVINEMRRRGLISQDKPVGIRRRLPRKRQAEPEQNKDALKMWRATTPLEGTPAEIYLRETRSIRLPYPPSIRFHPGKCAMVAAISRPTDRKIVAVQLTYLSPGGEKARLPNLRKSRKIFGAMGTGAVRLGAFDAHLGLAEGVETALSATEITGVPCWATLGDKRLAGITLPDSIRTVHLFADNDKPGRAAAEQAARAHKSQGRKVVTRYALEGNDWNDFALLKRRSTEL